MLFPADLESHQYNAVLPITREIKGTSKEKHYQELGLETFSPKR